MPEENKKGIIYYRVSSEDQAQFGVSLAHQKNTCSEYAERAGIKIIKLFHDDGVSAKTTNRPDLQEMFKYCKTHSKQIDYVIVYKIDRLSRNVNDYTDILGLLNKANINLLSTTEAINNTASGKFIGNIMAANAQFDNDVRSERVAACMLEKVKQGYWCWKAPLGYINTRDEFNKKIVTPDGIRDELITLAFEKFSTSNYSIEEIKNYLTLKGFRTWRGEHISSQSMNKLIKDKFYIGIMTVNKEEYTGKHKKLTDETTFYKCQQIISGITRGDTIAESRSCEAFPLRNFLLCGYCGRHITAAFSTGKLGKKYPYYRCYNKDCQSKKSISKKILEDDFLRTIKSITPKEEYLKAFKVIMLDVWKTKHKEYDKDKNKALKQLEELHNKKNKLIDMKIKDLLSDKEFKELNNKMKKDLESLQQRIREMKLDDIDIKTTIDSAFKIALNLPLLWEELDYKQKRKLQSLIFPKKLTYLYPKFETQQLCIFLKQKSSPEAEENTVVTPRRIELRLLG